MSNQYEKLVEQQARLKQKKFSGKILSCANLSIMKIDKHEKPVLAD